MKKKKKNPNWTLVHLQYYIQDSKIFLLSDLQNILRPWWEIKSFLENKTSYCKSVWMYVKFYDLKKRGKEKAFLDSEMFLKPLWNNNYDFLLSSFIASLKKWLPTISIPDRHYSTSKGPAWHLWESGGPPAQPTGSRATFLKVPSPPGW